MAPIRLGFIGLSADGQWAAKSHLPYFQSKPEQFQIMALQNSSVASAKRSVEKYGLGDHVACYDNPADLAADPNVDMVVVSVKVPEHHRLMMPAIQAKKHIFVEWPLAANVKEAKELTALVQQNGLRNYVGLQARHDPSIVKAKQMVEAGELGDILGSTMYGAGMVLGPTERPVYEYMADIENGANLLTIPAGHAVDALCYVLGEMISLQVNLAIRQPTMDIVSPEGEVLRTV